MFVLVQFLFRAAFGLALGMAITSPQQVSSGYYRNHLYVLLGFGVLESLVALRWPEQFALWPAAAAAVLSYGGAVCWLYEKPRAGLAALALVAAVSLAGSWLSAQPISAGATGPALLALDCLSGGLVLGLMLAAMFLGHWYLNAPGMALAPLSRLVLLVGAALVLRSGVEGWALGVDLLHGTGPNATGWIFLSLRWLSGIFGALALTAMTWQTLKIPNTQSATGILYVGVIATFLGELVSLLMLEGRAA